MGIFVISTYASCQITVQEEVDLPTGAGVVRAKVVLLVPVVIPFPPPTAREPRSRKFFAGMESLLDIFNHSAILKTERGYFPFQKGGPLEKSFGKNSEKNAASARKGAGCGAVRPGRPSGRWRTDDTIPRSCWPSRSPGISAGPLKKFLSMKRRKNHETSYP